MRSISIICITILCSLCCHAEDLVLKSTKRKLVIAKGKKRVGRYSSKRIEKARYYGIYFSASWCPHCQVFTPKLVRAYNELQKTHPDQFEFILVGAERSKKAQEEYLSKMPWPGLAFRHVAESALQRFKHKTIPRLAIVDRDGNMVTRGKLDALEVLRKCLERDAKAQASASTSQDEL